MVEVLIETTMKLRMTMDLANGSMWSISILKVKVRMLPLELFFRQTKNNLGLNTY